MRKFISILLLAFIAFAPVQAQKTKKAAEPKPEVPKITAEEALANYNFVQAQSILNNEIAELKKKNQPTLQKEKQLEYAQKAQRKMNAVEKVVVFDSVIVPRDQMLQSLCVSKESGIVDLASKYYPKAADTEATLFKSQLGDKLYYALPDEQGVMHLMESNVYCDGVTEGVALKGLDEDTEEHQNYPFMMGDGTTLYFAAQGDESLGGYDIFMTRYDADEHCYLQPENVGMPFNSSANDYLLCIDETYNVGCFVTDRNTSADSVCIYYFIPNATRHVYNTEEVSEDTLRSLARLSDIRQTWNDEMEVRVALNQLQKCRTEQAEEVHRDFFFHLTDNRICHVLSDFTSAQSREEATHWWNDKKDLEELQIQLQNLRRIYAGAHRSDQELMKDEILNLERQEEELIHRIKIEEKNIRKLELGL